MDQKTNFKNPPPLTDATGYEEWKNEVKMWQLVTDLDKSKQALALALSLSGQYRKVGREVPTDQLYQDNGVDTLLTKLDENFLKETADRAYESFENFDNFCRENRDMSDYIVEFERAYNKAAGFGMKLPDSVKAYKLLRMATLSPGDRRLVLANCENLDYPTVRSSLRRTFGDRQSTTSSGGPALIKEEPVFVTQDASKNEVLFTGGRPGTARGRGGFRRRGPQKGSNPLTKFGTFSRCNICGSTFHWAKQCPDGEKTESGAETIPKSIALTSITSDLMHECFCMGVLDTGCTSTVCGIKWYQQYLDQLSPQDRSKVTENNSLKKITFGDGETIESVKYAVIPAMFGDQAVSLTVEFVPVEIPLLISKSSMAKQKPLSAFTKIRLKFFEGRFLYCCQALVTCL